ncbi:EscU/YscU/HrcU family type III secretion system export apparatus switch protein [Parerythrobacter jejuensis]|uniref:Flagellar type III secretion system protein FlhB n=1 Tax=Parerythrobacter jejuensis TaxID=795812 RepID=A0A845ALY5_9SPHN|nr:flagellar type III secretion system protein FlhB [Parerythrobacter jejuensis]MXP30624.1 flagellar type III secretion system protein FlhB [Parerythrobacter jejuensis]MXP33384.1 flagellar type III secretion system protein FlhB [Parerythrobacter jejuensis]
MSEQSAGEKTFAPTQKRKQDATKKGDVLRSKELGTAIAVFAGGAWLIAAGPALLDGMETVARTSFRFDRAALEHFTPGTIFLGAIEAILPHILFLGLTVLFATAASQLIIGDGRFLASNLKPKGSRINPLSGLKRMFGTQGLIELGKGLLKVILLGGIAWWWGTRHLTALLGLGRGELTVQLSAAWDATISLLLMLALGLAIIAMIDWPIQFVRRMNRLKMTHQEMRDETKQTEGSPEKRAAQRQRQREIARGGVSKAMEEAQFLLTNPSHFAVALTYDPELAPAPVVLAKGRDEKALAMRELAAERGLPVLEYPALARSVYFTTRESQVIREELYVAVAALIAFVFSLKRGEHPPRPGVEVPVSLRFDAQGRSTGG